MKTYVPTITVITTLAFASAISCAQTPPPKARSATPAPLVTAVAPVAVTVAASTDDATAVEAQSEAVEQVNDKLWKIGARAGRASTSTRSLIIPKDAADAKSLTETEEDMSVMARILEKAANGKHEKGERYSTGYGLVFSGSGSTAKNLYIEGYGALFFMSVNFPLLPPATKEKASEPKSDADSEWEKTRDELHRPQGSGSDFSYNFEIFDSSNPFGSVGPAEEYDEEKVTELKESLTTALKNASHIRRLKGDDTVTVVVTGRSSGSKAATIRKSQSNNFNSSGYGTTWVTSPRSGSQPAAARLVIRAKRSDIEAFQKDKLSADDFRKKVSMFIY